VNGSFLPRLAINHHQLLSSTVGIKDLIHRQKIALKAQDVVLFGSPKEHGNRMKDSILTTLLVVALIVCWCVYSRYKLSQRDLNKMIKDMESLAKAEQALMDLQKELEKARTAQQEKAVEEELFKKSLDDGIPCTEEINRLKGEVEVLRNELQRAEVELQDKCWVPPPALQHWLQYTYELELKSYNRKKQSAEKQLKQAKDACDKLKKKRSSLMGAFVSTHGRSIDDVDKAILEARTALTEITQELQERMYRWKQIEMLVGGPIMNNPGLPYLETILRGIGRGPPYVGPGSVISNSQDDIDDDGASSIYCPSAVSAPASGSTVHMPIMRSKSVSSMINLRDGAVSRDGSSKESSTGEEDMSTETSEMTGGRDRRVTFGIRTDHREPITTLNQQRQSNKV
jgi:stromal interaction molecule 1